MNTLTPRTIAGAKQRANSDGVHLVHTGTRGARVDGARLMRDAAAFTLGSIAPDDVLARALGKSRSMVNRMRNCATAPVAKAAEAIYRLERRGLRTDPLLDVMHQAAALGAAEHARRIARRAAMRRAS